MSKSFLRNVAVIASVMISGLALSLVFVVRTTLAELIMLCAAPVAAALIKPRKEWPIVIVFVFLFGSVFGIGRIAAEMARSILENVSLQQAPEQYAYELVVYGFYGLISLIVWLVTRNGK